MEKLKNELNIAIRGIVFIFIPITAMVYVLYGLVFKTELNIFTFELAASLILFLNWMTDKYKQNEIEIQLENLRELEDVIQEGKWELMDRRQDKLLIRPSFDFPFSLVVPDQITIHYTYRRATIEGPNHYISLLGEHFKGDQTGWSRKWSRFKILASGFVLFLPLFLDSGILWESKVLYHNAFATNHEPVEGVDERTRGNLVENIINSGIGVENEAYIFYLENDNQIVRTDKDFKNKEFLTEIDSGYYKGDLNIAGDWLYYTEDKTIKRIQFDGTEKETIFGLGYPRNLQIQGEWIYFISEDAESNIYRMNLDGKNLERFSDVHASEFALYDNHLLISYSEEEYDFYKTIERIDLDNHSRTVLFEGDISGLVEWDGYYYYTNENLALIRREISEPTEPEVLTELWISDFIITEQGIFYGLDRTYQSGMYRIDLDGQNEEKLNVKSNLIDGLNQVGDSVIFRINNMNDEPTIRKLDPKTGEITDIEA